MPLTRNYCSASLRLPLPNAHGLATRITLDCVSESRKIRAHGLCGTRVSVHTGDQDVCHATTLGFCHGFSPELCALGQCDPVSKRSLLTGHSETRGAERHLTVQFNGVDYCLRVHEADYRVKERRNGIVSRRVDIQRQRPDTGKKLRDLKCECCGYFRGKNYDYYC